MVKVSENASVKFDQVILGEASEEDLKFVDPVTGHEEFYNLMLNGYARDGSINYLNLSMQILITVYYWT